eukprot:CAMPEP_0114525068 /NCGR_PEP_ID=MMETSP0109-20121206/22209_1 /TAXON_ID=29199 /ORGANISM="Chlorarachnion reptans, Strain CCCM449" /LENGTH=345 /DNA_ID=CAMNT_0001706589 /DNA_START=78 /DNA_END=1115 /DNA_ORIENTATION=-
MPPLLTLKQFHTLKPEELSGRRIRIGQTDFELEKLVAKTIYGFVWCAKFTGNESGNQKRAALKVSRTARTGRSYLEDPFSEARVLEELGCASSGNTDDLCENIVLCYGWSKETDDTYQYSAFAVEWSEIGDMYFHVIPGKGFEAKNEYGSDRTVVKEVLRGICNGVQHMHTRYKAHLDLSLENVLLFRKNTESVEYIPKICDFGVTRSLCNRSERVIPVARNARPGKQLYMAPEIAQGQEFTPTLADMYSVGIIAFIMMIGHPPYELPSFKDARFATIFTSDESGIRKLLNHFKKLDRMSNESVDFLSRLLTPENDRMSVDEALCHPYLAKNFSTENLSVSKQTE